LPQPHCFGLRHAPSQLRNAVVAAAPIVQMRIAVLAGFFDEPLL